jgi:hypothetical protein
MKKFLSGFALLVLISLMPGAQANSASDTLPSLKTIRYNLKFSVDFDHEILTGDCQLTVKNSGKETVTSVPLLLYRTLHVESIKSLTGTPLVFKQCVQSFTDWGQYQANVISVQLKQPISPGGQQTIEVSYRGYLLGYTETGMRYVRDRVDPKFTILRPDCLAYPSVGIPSWRANRATGMDWFDYNLQVKVPEGYTVANGGKFLEKKTLSDGVIWSFENIKPCWRIDVAIAHYVILKTGSNRVYCFPEDQKGGKRIVEAMKRGMAFLTQSFGPLINYKGFSVIEIPSGWGSQTDVTAIIQTADAFKDSGQTFQLYHELTHLWAVEEKDPFPSRFEHEGLAMFMQYLLTERLDHKPHAVQKGIDQLMKRFREQCKKNPEAAKVAMIDYGKKNLTGLSYTKGMVFFATLFELTGEAQFNRLMTSFYRQYVNTGATTDQFVQFIKKNAGINLSVFFNDWVYTSKSSQLILDGTPMKQIVARYRSHK